MWQTLLIDHCALCPFEHPSSSWDTPVQLPSSIPAVEAYLPVLTKSHLLLTSSPTWFSFLCLRTGTELPALGWGQPFLEDSLPDRDSSLWDLGLAPIQEEYLERHTLQRKEDSCP